ncbi:hypothetical protein ACLMJK_009228 [Lecanora helva]
MSTAPIPHEPKRASYSKTSKCLHLASEFCSKLTEVFHTTPNIGPCYSEVVNGSEIGPMQESTLFSGSPYSSSSSCGTINASEECPSKSRLATMLEELGPSFTSVHGLGQQDTQDKGHDALVDFIMNLRREDVGIDANSRSVSGSTLTANTTPERNSTPIKGEGEEASPTKVKSPVRDEALAKLELRISEVSSMVGGLQTDLNSARGEIRTLETSLRHFQNQSVGQGSESPTLSLQEKIRDLKQRLEIEQEATRAAKTESERARENHTRELKDQEESFANQISDLKVSHEVTLSMVKEIEATAKARFENERSILEANLQQEVKWKNDCKEWFENYTTLAIDLYNRGKELEEILRSNGLSFLVPNDNSLDREALDMLPIPRDGEHVIDIGFWDDYATRGSNVDLTEEAPGEDAEVAGDHPVPQIPQAGFLLEYEERDHVGTVTTEQIYHENDFARQNLIEEVLEENEDDTLEETHQYGDEDVEAAVMEGPQAEPKEETVQLHPPLAAETISDYATHFSNSFNDAETDAKKITLSVDADEEVYDDLFDQSDNEDTDDDFLSQTRKSSLGKGKGKEESFEDAAKKRRKAVQEEEDADYARRVQAAFDAGTTDLGEAEDNDPVSTIRTSSSSKGEAKAESSVSEDEKRIESQEAFDTKLALILQEEFQAEEARKLQAALYAAQTDADEEEIDDSPRAIQIRHDAELAKKLQDEEDEKGQKKKGSCEAEVDTEAWQEFISNWHVEPARPTVTRRRDAATITVHDDTDPAFIGEAEVPRPFYLLSESTPQESTLSSQQHADTQRTITPTTIFDAEIGRHLPTHTAPPETPIPISISFANTTAQPPFAAKSAAPGEKMPKRTRAEIEAAVEEALGKRGKEEQEAEEEKAVVEEGKKGEKGKESRQERRKKEREGKKAEKKGGKRR